MKIAMQILTAVLSCALIDIFLVRFLPRLTLRYQAEEELAAKQREVIAPKEITVSFTIIGIILALIGASLIIFPSICEFFEIDYVVSLIVVLVPSAISLIMLIILLPKIRYDETSITYINVLGFKLTMSKSDATKQIVCKNRTVLVTKFGKINLLNAMIGKDAFISWLNS